MKLIGMLDSPYVRRVAVSLQLLGLEFEHQSLSVFCNDGLTLMDSTLILDFAEALAAGRKSLMPLNLNDRRHALRTIGLALAACEKSVQILYERNLRPVEKRHAPWVSRVTGQLLAAFEALESDFATRQHAAGSRDINQAGVSTAVAWQFAQQMLPDVVPASSFPNLQEFSQRVEALPEFSTAPHGSGTCPC